MEDLPPKPWAMSPSVLSSYFIRLFFRLGSATAGLLTHGSNVYRYIEVFFWKFVDHFCSCFHLADRTSIPGQNQSFYDYSSINVLVRAAWEAYLTFSYIYRQSGSEEVKNLRFWGWMLSGLLDRQNAIPMNEEIKQKLARERHEIEKIRNELRANPAFTLLKQTERKAMLSLGRWRFASWSALAVGAGFSSFLAKQMYGLLCSYAHSGSGSLIQLAGRTKDAELMKMGDTTLNILFIVGAHFAVDYCEAISNNSVEISQTERTFLDPWIRLTAIDPSPRP